MAESINTIQEILIKNVSQFDLESYNDAVNRRLAALANLGQRFGQEGQGTYIKKVTFRDLLGMSSSSSSKTAKIKVLNVSGSTPTVQISAGFRDGLFDTSEITASLIPEYVSQIFIKAAQYVVNDIFKNEDKRNMYLAKSVSDVVGTYQTDSLSSLNFYVPLSTPVDSIFNSITNEWLRFVIPLYIASDCITGDLSASEQASAQSDQTLFSATFTLAVNAVVDESEETRDYVCQEYGLGMTELGQVLYNGELSNILIEGQNGESTQIIIGQAQITLIENDQIDEERSYTTEYIRILNKDFQYQNNFVEVNEGCEVPEVKALSSFDSMGNQIFIIDFSKNLIESQNSSLNNGDILYSFVEVYSLGIRINVCSTISIYKEGKWEPLKIVASEADSQIFTFSDLVSTASIEKAILADIESYIAGQTQKITNKNGVTSTDWFYMDTIRFKESHAGHVLNNQKDATLYKLQGNICVTQPQDDTGNLAILEISHNVKDKVKIDEKEQSTDTFLQILFNNNLVANQFSLPLSYLYEDMTNNGLSYEPELPLIVPKNLGIYRPSILDSSEVLAVGPQMLDLRKSKFDEDYNICLNGQFNWSSESGKKTSASYDWIYSLKNTGQRLIFGAYRKEDFDDAEEVKDPTPVEFFEIRSRFGTSPAANADSSITPRVDFISNFEEGIDANVDGKRQTSFLHALVKDSYIEGSGTSFAGPERIFKIFSKFPKGLRQEEDGSKIQGSGLWLNNWHDDLIKDDATDSTSIYNTGLASTSQEVKFNTSKVAQRSRITGYGVRVEACSDEKSHPTSNSEDFVRGKDSSATAQQFAELQHYGIRANGNFSLVLENDIESKAANPVLTVKKRLLDPALVQMYSPYKKSPKVEIVKYNPYVSWQYRPFASKFIAIPKSEAEPLSSNEKAKGARMYVLKDPKVITQNREDKWKVDLLVNGSMYTVDLRQALRQRIITKDDLVFTDQVCENHEALTTALESNSSPLSENTVYLMRFYYPFMNMIPVYTSNEPDFVSMFDFKNLPFKIATPPYPLRDLFL